MHDLSVRGACDPRRLNGIRLCSDNKKRPAKIKPLSNIVSSRQTFNLSTSISRIPTFVNPCSIFVLTESSGIQRHLDFMIAPHSFSYDCFEGLAVNHMRPLSAHPILATDLLKRPTLRHMKRKDIEASF